MGEKERGRQLCHPHSPLSTAVVEGNSQKSTRMLQQSPLTSYLPVHPVPVWKTLGCTGRGFCGIRPLPNSQGDNQVHLVPPELTHGMHKALLLSPLQHQGLVLLSQSTALWF